MDSTEIKQQLEMTYKELLVYLKTKYGVVPENYYLDINCTRKSKTNLRSAEGLFIHHDYEYDPANPLVNNLSKKELAVQFDYMYQHAENLTYCNWLEHLVLHIKINLLRREQLGRYINDGVINHFIPDLNDMYRYLGKPADYQKIAFSLIEDNYSDYCDIVSYWLQQLNAEAEGKDWKRLSNIRK